MTCDDVMISCEVVWNCVEVEFVDGTQQGLLQRYVGDAGSHKTRNFLLCCLTVSDIYG